MTWLVVISILLSVLGIGLATWKGKALPESVSALVYDLPKGRQWLWTLWVWLVGLTAGIPLLDAMEYNPLQFMAFLMTAALLFCGAMPLVSKERNIPHYVAAMAAGAMSQLCVLSLCGVWSLAPWLLLMLLFYVALFSSDVVQAEKLFDGLRRYGVLVAEALCAAILYVCLLTFL